MGQVYNQHFKLQVVFALIDCSTDMNPTRMKKLFAISKKTEEVIVSESSIGSKTILFIERITKQENEELYDAVMKLTDMAKSPDLDLKEFKALDKACQGMYIEYKNIK